MVNTLKFGDEHSGFKNSGEFLYYLGEYQTLTNNTSSQLPIYVNIEPSVKI
jgi:hypothetical protein